jgi:hypothetical protein
MHAKSESRRRHPLALLLLSLALGCASAQAAQHCVSTGAQLANALTSAASNGQDDEIRVVATTLTGTSNSAGNPRWYYFAAESDLDLALTLSGGWSSGNNCLSQISLDPQDTVLDAQNTGIALSFVPQFSGVMSGDISVRNLTITRASNGSAGVGSAINWNVTGAITTSLILENLLIVAGNAPGTGSSIVNIAQSGSGWAKLRNLIIHANSSQSAPLSITMSGSSYALISNNSIFGNQTNSGASGLSVTGVATLANNAIAENTSTLPTSFQFYSAVPGSLTLRNNHFATKSMAGAPFSESGTTTGDPQWTSAGSLKTPGPVSPLRDSGLNNPTGGLASTDFDGSARIVNTTVDRGAVEAEAIPHIGPTISAVSPTPGTGQFMPDGLINTTVTATISFTATGGTGAGTTSLTCVDDNAAATLSASANQTIAVGQSVAPIVVTMSYVQSGYNLGVVCTANTNGNVYSFVYAFFVPNASANGPLIQALAPQAGTTTTMDASVGQTASHSITFTTQGGAAGGEADLACAPLNGLIAVTGNATQTVGSGASVLPVEVSMEVTGQAQAASIRCVATRVGHSPLNLDYHFAVNAVDAIFVSSFEP